MRCFWWEHLRRSCQIFLGREISNLSSISRIPTQTKSRWQIWTYMTLLNIWQLLILCFHDSTVPPEASPSSRLLHHVLLFLFYPAEVNTHTHAAGFLFLNVALRASSVSSCAGICPFCIFQAFFANQLARCALFNGFSSTLFMPVMMIILQL